MLNYIYRLKKKKGMVLFFVVMVMALLIIMSTAAYYTARNSYNTVLSNYDFEQMYLSATTISDIIIDAMNGENAATVTTDGAGNEINQFYALIGDSTHGDGALNLMKASAFATAFAGQTDYRYRPSTVNYTGNPVRVVTTSLDGITETEKSKIAEAIDNPVKEGVLDGATVEITFKKAERTYEDTHPVDNGDQTLTFKDKYSCSYSVKTIAYYRNNYIIVEDVVKEDGVEVTSTWKNTPGTPPTPPDPGEEGTPGTDPWTEHIWHDNPGGLPSGATFFTATGQTIGPNGEYAQESKTVVIKAHEISDNAYFENKYTFFPSGNNNEFKGGIRSSGTVVLDKFTTNLPAPTETERHDWIIGEDLIIGGANANGLDLNGNNLYVKGDLIIDVNSGFDLKAANIYVQGKIYDLGANASRSITGNVYCGGYECVGNDTVKTKYENAYKQYNSTIGSYAGLSPKDYDTSTGTKSFTGGGGLKATGTVKTLPGKTINGGQMVSSGTWNLTDPTVVAKFEYKDDDGNTKTSTETSINSVYSTSDRTGDWGNGNARTSTLENALTIDVKTKNELDYTITHTENATKTQLVDTNGNAVENGFTYQYTTEDGTRVVAEYYNDNDIRYTYYPAKYNATTDKPAKATYQPNSSNGTVIIDIPYTESGYALNLNYAEKRDGAGNIETETKTESVVVRPGYSLGPPTYQWVNEVRENVTTTTVKSVANGKVNINVGTKEDKTMPIVLKSNFDDGSGNATDENGNNAFSWVGSGYARSGSSGNDTKVQLVASNTDGTVKSSETAKGNVAFSLGDYDKTTGKYVNYDKNNFTGIETATYYTNEMLAIGTKKQLDKMTGKYQDYNTFEDMLDNSVPKPGYENRVIISSNKRDATAIDGARLNNTLCGYYYAPNGRYDTYNANGGNTPIFGGMIVSTYSADLSHWKYAEPDPDIISSLLSGIGVGGGSGGWWEDIEHEGTPGTPGRDPSEGDPGTPADYSFSGDPVSAGSGGIDSDLGGKNYLG